MVPFGTFGTTKPECGAVAELMYFMTFMAGRWGLLLKMRRKSLIFGLLIRDCTRRMYLSTGKLSIIFFEIPWVGAIYYIKDVS